LHSAFCILHKIRHSAFCILHSALNSRVS
jgi:hypothetical protein